MTEKIKSKKQRIIYYSILAVMLILIGVVTVIAITQNNRNNDVNLEKPTQSDDSGSGSNNEDKPDPKPDDDKNQPDKPVVEVISFITPVKGGSCSKEYTDSTLVYSSTLGVYTGHSGMDFTAQEGADVVAVYKGTVKEITTSYLPGTTVKIDHGNGLYTVYNSIEPSETLKVGDRLNQGDVIGKISDNNKQEYKDGAHLHFEVIENKTVISPLKYLTVEEK